VRVAPNARKKAEGCFFKLKSSPTAAYSCPVGGVLEMRNIIS
jgi:hypothetical protein